MRCRCCDAILDQQEMDDIESMCRSCTRASRSIFVYTNDHEYAHEYLTDYTQVYLDTQD